MAKQLTEADLATWFVEVTTAEGTQTRTVRAAYDIPEPGWLVFKDHEHRVAARFSAHIVVGVTRADEPDMPSDEDRIRDAMAIPSADEARTRPVTR